MIPFPSPMGGQCSCPCQQRYPMGALVVHDPYIHGTVIAGHQTGTKR